MSSSLSDRPTIAVQAHCSHGFTGRTTSSSRAPAKWTMRTEEEGEFHGGQRSYIAGPHKTWRSALFLPEYPFARVAHERIIVNSILN
jgi:hypothetical protein